MDLPYGPRLWMSSVDLVYGLPLWTSSMDFLLCGVYPCTMGNQLPQSISELGSESKSQHIMLHVCAHRHAPIHVPDQKFNVLSLIEPRRHENAHSHAQEDVRTRAQIDM